MDKFNQSGPLSMPRTPGVPFKEAENKTPAHGGQAVAVSIGLSIGTGMVSFVAVLMISSGIGGAIYWRPAFIIGGLIMLIIAVASGLDWGWKIIWKTEKITGIDIIPDGYIGQPPQKPRHFVVDAMREGNSFTRIGLDMPENDKVFMAWIDAGLHQQSLAIEKWEQPFGYVYPGGTKTSVYMLFKAGAVSKGLLLDRGSHGIMLSNEGRHEFRQMLEQMRELPQLMEGEVNE